MEKQLGTGNLLTALEEHPYINQPFSKREKVERRILDKMNRGRPYREKAVGITYYLASKSKDKGEDLWFCD